MAGFVTFNAYSYYIFTNTYAYNLCKCMLPFAFSNISPCPASEIQEEVIKFQTSALAHDQVLFLFFSPL